MAHFDARQYVSPRPNRSCTNGITAAASNNWYITDVTMPARPRPPLIREFSAGGVVVRQIRGAWHLAAIEPQGRQSSTPGKIVLALPKGIVDTGEKPEQTALREVREETGLEAELVTKLDDIKYFYVRSWGDRERVFKIVSFFLLRHKGGKLGDISAEMQHEVKEALWVPLIEAPQRLSYKGERDVARLALDYIHSHPEL
jgi:8-oxo-dGTP pyrophosphatase MutT (NUDIX family)